MNVVPRQLNPDDMRMRGPASMSYETSWISFMLYQNSHHTLASSLGSDSQRYIPVFGISLGLGILEKQP